MAKHNSEELKHMITFLAKSLVDTPDSITVEESGTRDTVVFRIGTAPTEAGYLIGRAGKTAQAIRQIMQATGRRLQTRVVVEFAGDNEDS